MGRVPLSGAKLLLAHDGGSSSQCSIGAATGDAAVRTEDGGQTTPPGVADSIPLQKFDSSGTPSDPIVVMDDDDEPIFDSTPVPPGPAATFVFGSLDAGDAHYAQANQETPPGADVKMVDEHSRFGVSPFSAGMKHKHTLGPTCHAVLKLLEQKHSYAHDSTWFVHNIPDVLVLEAGQLYAAFRRHGEFSVDVVDALSRLFTALDRDMYLEVGLPDNIWRHFLPASFAVGVVNGEDPGSTKFKDMFIGDHLGYDVENCRMFLAPFPKNGSWVVYTWDFLRREVGVMDPAMQNTTITQSQWTHDDTMQALHTALFECIDNFFRG